MTTSRGVYKARIHRTVTCERCGAIFTALTAEPVSLCFACVSFTTDTVKARSAARGECGLCGRGIEVADGELVHVEPERDVWHRPLYVTVG